MRNLFLRRALSTLFALALFGWCARYLATGFDWPAVLSALQGAEVGWLALAGLSLLFYFGVRAARWMVMIRTVRPDIRFAGLYVITAASIALSNMTPGQAGEALKVEWLHRRGLVGRITGYGSFAIERVVDLMVVVAMGLVALLLEGPGPGQGRRLPLLLLGLLVALGLGSVLLWRVRFGGRWGARLDQARSAVPDFATLVQVVGLSALGWSAVALGWWLTLRTVGVVLSASQTLMLLSVTTVGVLLSFVPAGLGVAEVLGAALLERMGVPAVPAQVGVVALRGFGLLSILLGGVHIPLARVALGPASRAAPAPTPVELPCPTP